MRNLEDLINIINNMGGLANLHCSIFVLTGKTQLPINGIKMQDLTTDPKMLFIADDFA